MLSLPKLSKRISSRRQIAIKGVEDSVLLLPNDKYRIILEASAINFELKSKAEQEAVLEVYKNFLNSLPGQLQILVRIRELDVNRYLEDFRVKRDQEKEAVYKNQIKNYTEFVKSLVKTNKILARRFYIVIPFDNEKDAALAKEQLNLRRDIVRKGLEKLGIQTRQLRDLELLELFYSFYNHDSIKSQPLTEETLAQLLEEQ